MHAEIIAKLEKLTGPDREVDAELVRLFVSDKEAALHLHYGIDAYRFTSSIDAAVALVERVLPGAYRASGKTSAYPGMIPGSPPEKFFARVGDWGEPVRSYHDCEPIAILLALFRALSARTQGGNDEAE